MVHRLYLREINFRLKVLVISSEFSKESREVMIYPPFGNSPMIMLLMLQDGWKVKSSFQMKIQMRKNIR